MTVPPLVILIPAAGTGERFKAEGYTTPKALVDVVGKPMLQRVIGNLRPKIQHKVIIISRLEDKEVAPLLHSKDIAIHLDEPTEGAVDTLLKAREYLTTAPLLVANCDQLISWNVSDFIEASAYLDGGIAVFRSNKEHHSYIITDQWGVVTKIAEKKVISNRAVTGAYYFRHGTDFVRYADQVIKANLRFKNEFYVSSVLDRMIAEGLSFITYDAPVVPLGTPDELHLFEMAVEVAQTL